MVSQLLQNKKVLFIINLSFWLTLCLLDIIQSYYYTVNYGEKYDWAQRLSWIGGYYLPLWLLSFVIYKLYQITRQLKLKKILLIHFPISIAFGLFHIFLTVFFTTASRILVGYYDLAEKSAISLFLKNLKIIYPIAISGFLMYWMVHIILLAFDFYKKYRDQYVHTIELEAKLTHSQLQNLKMQLRPHFLFNAMNTIAMMIRRKKDTEAIDMISGLSDMLRSSLTQESKQMIRLADELDLVEKYLKIETIRFQDKLKVTFDIQEKTLGSLVPNLILQPIVENAFKHGISRCLDDAQILISALINEDMLQISVYNTGPELPENWSLEQHKGIGLGNTLTRLRQLYGKHYCFNIYSKDGGTYVCLDIPLK